MPKPKGWDEFLTELKRHDHYDAQSIFTDYFNKVPAGGISFDNFKEFEEVFKSIELSVPRSSLNPEEDRKIIFNKPREEALKIFLDRHHSKHRKDFLDGLFSKKFFESKKTYDQRLEEFFGDITNKITTIIPSEIIPDEIISIVFADYLAEILEKIKPILSEENFAATREKLFEIFLTKYPPIPAKFPKMLSSLHQPQEAEMFLVDDYLERNRGNIPPDDFVAILNEFRSKFADDTVKAIGPRFVQRYLDSNPELEVFHFHNIVMLNPDLSLQLKSYFIEKYFEKNRPISLNVFSEIFDKIKGFAKDEPYAAFIRRCLSQNFAMDIREFSVTFDKIKDFAKDEPYASFIGRCLSQDFSMDFNEFSRAFRQIYQYTNEEIRKEFVVKYFQETYRIGVDDFVKRIKSIFTKDTEFSNKEELLGQIFLTYFEQQPEIMSPGDFISFAKNISDENLRANLAKKYLEQNFKPNLGKTPNWDGMPTLFNDIVDFIKDEKERSQFASKYFWKHLENISFPDVSRASRSMDLETVLSSAKEYLESNPRMSDDLFVKVFECINIKAVGDEEKANFIKRYLEIAPGKIFMSIEFHYMMKLIRSPEIRLKLFTEYFTSKPTEHHNFALTLLCFSYDQEKERAKLIETHLNNNPEITMENVIRIISSRTVDEDARVEFAKQYLNKNPATATPENLKSIFRCLKETGQLKLVDKLELLPRRVIQEAFDPDSPLGEAVIKKFLDAEHIAEYLLSRKREIAFDAGFLERCTLDLCWIVNRLDKESDEEAVARVSGLYKNFLNTLENPNGFDNFKKFFSAFYDKDGFKSMLRSNERGLRHIYSIFSSFGKEKTASFFNLPNWQGLINESFVASDGCYANIGAKITMIICSSLMEDDISGATLKAFMEKVFIPVSNAVDIMHGAEIQGEREMLARDVILENRILNSYCVSRDKFLSAVQEEVEKNRDSAKRLRIINLSTLIVMSEEFPNLRESLESDDKDWSKLIDILSLATGDFEKTKYDNFMQACLVCTILTGKELSQEVSGDFIESLRQQEEELKRAANPNRALSGASAAPAAPVIGLSTDHSAA